jgi:hypothetical protein
MHSLDNDQPAAAVVPLMARVVAVLTVMHDAAEWSWMSGEPLIGEDEVDEYAYQLALTESHERLVERGMTLVWVIGEMEEFDVEERDKPSGEECDA